MSHSSDNTQVPAGHSISIHKAVTRFMDALPSAASALSLQTQKTLAEVGLTREFKQLRHLRGDLWELKVDTGKPKLYIRYLFINRGDEFVITNAYFKQTNQAPQREIDLALQRA